MHYFEGHVHRDNIQYVRLEVPVQKRKKLHYQESNLGPSGCKPNVLPSKQTVRKCLSKKEKSTPAGFEPGIFGLQAERLTLQLSHDGQHDTKKS